VGTRLPCPDSESVPPFYDEIRRLKRPRAYPIRDLDQSPRSHAAGQWLAGPAPGRGEHGQSVLPGWRARTVAGAGCPLTAKILPS